MKNQILNQKKENEEKEKKTANEILGDKDFLNDLLKEVNASEVVNKEEPKKEEKKEEKKKKIIDQKKNI